MAIGQVCSTIDRSGAIRDHCGLCPQSFPVAIINDHSGLRDAWTDTHPDVPVTFAPNATLLEVLHMFGATTDSPINTYSAGKSLDDYARQFMEKRLDYVLYRPPVHSLCSSKTPILEPTQAGVVFTEHVLGKSYSFSDHFGLEATFAIHLPEGQPGSANNLSDIEVPAPNTITENRSRVSSSTRRSRLPRCRTCDLTSLRN